MSNPFLGEIRIFGGNFAPRGWAFCNGQLIPISQNTALFSLLGTFYGGDGRSTFGLPDLQGRFPMHWGQGPGLSLHDLGEQGGADTVTVLASQMPPHTHPMNASTQAATTRTPSPGVVPASPTGAPVYAPANDLLPLADAVVAQGGGQPHENRSPYLALSFIIAMQGIYPARN
jgi:microcystin-dependent protein